MADVRFKDMNIEEYVRQLGSASPTPGGGAAAALSAAQGAALLIMVANHTIGKEKYAAFEELNLSVRDEADSLMEELLNGMDRDAAAFSELISVYAMRAESAADKTEKDKAIADASRAAAEAPLAVMQSALAGLELANRLLGHSNPMLESDIYVAAVHFSAAIESSSCNVEVNLPAVRKVYPGEADRLSSESEKIKAKSEALKIIKGTRNGQL